MSSGFPASPSNVIQEQIADYGRLAIGVWQHVRPSNSPSAAGTESCPGVWRRSRRGAAEGRRTDEGQKESSRPAGGNRIFGCQVRSSSSILMALPRRIL